MKEIKLKTKAYPFKSVQGCSSTLFKRFTADSIRSFGVAVQAMGLVGGTRYHLGIAQLGVDFWEPGYGYDYDDYEDYDGDYTGDYYE